MLKISLLFKKFTKYTGSNLTILRIKNAKLSRYCFCMNTNIWRDFQICISVLLNLRPKNALLGVFRLKLEKNYCDIWNQHPRICRNAKNCEKKKEKEKNRIWDQNAVFRHFGL